MEDNTQIFSKNIFFVSIKNFKEAIFSLFVDTIPNIRSTLRQEQMTTFTLLVRQIYCVQVTI
jgi:hypothetical protein